MNLSGDVEASEPFLVRAGQGESDHQESSRKARMASRPQAIPKGRAYLRLLYAVIVVQSLIIALIAITAFANTACQTDNRKFASHSISGSPGDIAVMYRSTVFEKYGYRSNPYAQPPSPEVDAAWHRLLRGMNIVVDDSSLEQHNATSLRLETSGQYVAQLGVYHELHCLKKLKHWIHRDHYWPSLSAEQFSEQQTHAEHCLEWIRNAALCRGDTTLTTLYWEEGRIETAYPIQRQCVDSDALLKWSEAHSVDLGVEQLQPPAQHSSSGS